MSDLPDRAAPALASSLADPPIEPPADTLADLRRPERVRARQDAMLGAVDVGLWYCDLPFDTLVWDRKVKEHSWLPADARVTIDTFYARIHPDDRNRTRAAIERSIAEHGPYDIVYRTVAPDDHPEAGAVRWVRAIGYTAYDVTGQPIRFDGVTVDVSATKRAEAAERAARADAEAERAAADLDRRRLAAVLEQLPVGVYLAEAPSGRLVLHNAAVRRIWGADAASADIAGYSRDYVGYHPAGTPRAGRRYESHEWPLARALTHGEVVADERLEVQHPGGARATLSVSAAPVRDADGRVVGGVVTSIDVTERERLLAETEAARAELEAANVQLQEQGLELELSNQQLQEQAAELEAQAEELQAAAAHLEEQVEAADAARRAAEAERARAAGILESTADAYFLLDADWRVAAVNGAMERGSGLPRADLLGRDFWEAFPGAAGTAFETYYRAAAERGVATRFTHDYSDGRLELVVEADAYPADGPDGRRGVAVFWRDVTARVRAEAALRASEAKYRALFESADQGFGIAEILVDAAGRPVDYRMLEINPPFERLTGQSRERFLAGRTVREVAPELEEHWYAFYGTVGLTGEPAHAEIHAAAWDRWFQVSAYRVGEPAARQVAILFTEVTAARRAAAERERLLAESEAARAAAEAERGRAEAANQAKGLFLANMSHELRTPLNAIGGYAQLLDMGLHGPVTDDQKGALERIQSAQTRLLSLINDILNYAKLESGRVEYDVRPVEVADVVRDVAPLVEPQMRAKGLAFDLRLPDAPCAVWADREKLGQVLVNLLSNAIKFTPSPDPRTGAPGRVTVEVGIRRRDAERHAGGGGGSQAGEPLGGAGMASGPHGYPLAEVVFLRVTDTGIGIPPGKQDSIFEPFVQVRSGHGSAYANATEGTGLGLAISRDLARGMGGDLRVRSAAGEGATFTVKLRRVADASGRATDRRTVEERREDERRAAEDRRHAGTAEADEPGR